MANSMTVNGKEGGGAAPAAMLLIHFLREQLQLTQVPHIGRHKMKRRVHGRPRRQVGEVIIMFAVQANGADIRTIGKMAAQTESRTRCRKSFREMHGLQWGAPGMIVRAYRLPGKQKSDRRRSRFGISGHRPLHGLPEYDQSHQYAAAKISGVPFQEAAE